MSTTPPPLPAVVDAAGAAAADARAIAAGVPSRALMQRAGAAAAAEIARRHADRLAPAVLLVAGPGNNGGDAWVVARALAAAGVRCHVREVAPAATDDARAERALALPVVRTDLPPHGVRLVVDGVLGTGSRGAPRGAAAEAVAEIAARRDGGALVVALDVPSGLDAGSGAAEGAVRADLTLTFGTLKRGHLVARAHCGRILLLDIGLLAEAPDDGGADGAAAPPRLVTGAWVRAMLPAIAADAHKGTRGKLVVVGGERGMAGAAVLAGRAAIAAGAGMVRLLVAPPSLPVVQAALPQALAGDWPADDAALDRDVVEWADAVVVGPGIGRGDGARALLDRLLARWRGPLLLDADALTLHAGRLDALAAALAGRPALLTPHPVEFARLAGREVGDVLASRFEAGGELAARLGATVLLKGVPTVVSAPDGRRLVSAAGTPVLAAAGSGDLLAGLAGTLLGQGMAPLDAAACAAWAHGRAAEIAGGRGVRGATLTDVERAIPRVWRERPASPAYPVLADLPAVP